MLLTNDPQPLAPGSSGQTVVERKNLLQLSLRGNVQVLPLAPSFDWSFYGRLHGPDAPPVSDTISLGSLMHAVARRTHKKRRLCALMLRVTPGAPAGLPASAAAAPVRFAVDLYSLVKRAKPQAPSKVLRADHAPVRSVPGNVIVPASGEIFSIADRTLTVRKTYAYGAGSARLVFTKEEQAQARSGPGEPGIALLGFSPRDGDGGAGPRVGLREADNVGCSHFLYPAEAELPGSGAAFSALHGAMLRRGVIGLALLTRAARSPPKLVALLPSAATADAETGEQLTPPGLHVIYLPYADQARAPELVTLPQPPAAASESAVAAAAALTRALALADFRCDDFSNPDVAQFNRCLEHYALVADDPVEEALEVQAVEDTTLPEVEAFAERHADTICAQLSAAVATDLPELEAAPGRGGGGGGGSKRKALEPGEAEAKAGDDSARAAKVARLHGEGVELRTATVDDLKAYCRTHGLKLSGTKPELLARVSASLGSTE